MTQKLDQGTNPYAPEGFLPPPNESKIADLSELKKQGVELDIKDLMQLSWLNFGYSIFS